MNRTGRTYWALVQPRCSTVAVDAAERLDIYASREAALRADNVAIGDKLVVVKVTITQVVGRVEDLR